MYADTSEIKWTRHAQIPWRENHLFKNPTVYSLLFHYIEKHIIDVLIAIIPSNKYHVKVVTRNT